MPKYLIEANYVGDGAKGLIKEGALLAGRLPKRRSNR
jgi:hypothetical protein